MKNDIHDLGLVLDSRVKLILIESWDERRVLQTTTAQPLQVTLVGEHAADLAKEHIAQQARFGISGKRR